MTRLAARRPDDAVLFVVLGLIWGSSYLAGKLAGDDLGTSTFVALRLAVGVTALGGVMVALRHPVPSRGLLPHFVVVGLLGVVLPISLITWGQRGIDSGLASIFNAATPLFTAFIASVALRDEPIRAGRMVGIAAGFIGVVLVVGDGVGTGGDPLSLGAIVVAAGSYATAAVYARRVLSGGPPMTVAFGQIGIGLVLGAAAALAIDHPALVVPPGPALAAALWLGVMGSAIAPLIYFRLIARWDATRTTLVYDLIPVVGIALGVLVLGERPHPAMLAGAAVVIGGVMLASRPDVLDRLLSWRRLVAAAPSAVVG